MPDDLKSAFLHKHGNKSWIIAHKGDDGRWRAAFGMLSPEIADLADMHFIPLDVIPDLDL
jgi:hypothetical protein